MNIGDRVRMVHSPEEGIIIKILNKEMVEVEIEDGFGVPALKSELVVIASEENKRFGEVTTDKTQNIKQKKTKHQESISSKSKEVVATKGIFIAFQELNDKKMALYLINNTDFDLLFIVGRERNSTYESTFRDLLRSKTKMKIADADLQNFDKWGMFILQFLFFKQGIQTFKPPFLKKIRFRANTFFKSKQTAPILEKEAYLFQIDKDLEEINNVLEQVEEVLTTKEKPSQPAKIDVEKLKAGMFEKQPQAYNKDEKSFQNFIKPAKHEVDLHIEEITKDYEKMNSTEIIQLQLKTFEKEFENAIANGMSEIIFIHGVGNGKLRTEIHKRLSKSSDIEYYKDARKEKFGYGATQVKLKS